MKSFTVECSSYSLLSPLEINEQVDLRVCTVSYPSKGTRVLVNVLSKGQKCRNPPSRKQLIYKIHKGVSRSVKKHSSRSIRSM